MKKGTAINYKGSLYNEDGDRPVNLESVPKIKSQEELQAALADEEIKFMHIGEDKIYGINKLKYKEQYFLLLEPNPVTFYFSLAYDSITQIKNAKRNLEKALLLAENDGQKAQAFSYLFRVASVCIIFTFSALEAFLNQCLPDYSLMEHKGKMIGKKRIENSVRFNEKLNEIIPKILNKNFAKNHSYEFEKIINLKTLRDKFIHLKEVQDGFTSYNEIYQEVLNNDFEEIVMATKKCINFYCPDLIVNYNLKTQIK